MAKTATIAAQEQRSSSWASHVPRSTQAGFLRHGSAAVGMSSMTYKSVVHGGTLAAWFELDTRRAG